MLCSVNRLFGRRWWKLEENDHTLTSGQIKRVKPLGCNDSNYTVETCKQIYCVTPLTVVEMTTVEWHIKQKWITYQIFQKQPIIDKTVQCKSNLLPITEIKIMFLARSTLIPKTPFRIHRRKVPPLVSLESLGFVSRSKFLILTSCRQMLRDYFTIVHDP
jgi:hypothetical protein